MYCALEVAPTVQSTRDTEGGFANAGRHACISLRDLGDTSVDGWARHAEADGGRERRTERTSASSVLHYKAYGCTQLVLKPQEYEVGQGKTNMCKPASGLLWSARVELVFTPHTGMSCVEALRGGGRAGDGAARGCGWRPGGRGRCVWCDMNS